MHPTSHWLSKVLTEGYTHTLLYNDLCSYMESWNATLELLNNNSFSMSVAPGRVYTSYSDSSSGHDSLYYSVLVVSKVTGLSLRSKKPSITSAWQVGPFRALHHVVLYTGGCHSVSLQHSMAYNTRPSTAKQLPTNM